MSRDQAGAGGTHCCSRAVGCTSPRAPRSSLELCTVLEPALQSSSLASAMESCGTTSSTGGWRRTSPPTKWGWSCSRAPGRAARASWCIETHALCSGPPGTPAGAVPCSLNNPLLRCPSLGNLLPLAGLARLPPSARSPAVSASLLPNPIHRASRTLL